MEKKVYSFLQQAFVFALIMLISNGIAKVVPLAIPPSLIGMLLLFGALCTGIVKLEQIEGLANSLSSVITFLFVPSGISLVNSLGIMKSSGIQILVVILIATLALMAATGWGSSLLLGIKDRHAQADEEKSLNKGLKEVS